MNPTLGLEAAPEHLPHSVRSRLVELDRLREVWTGHQARRPPHQWVGNRARLFRRHILEVHALTGAPPVAPDTVDRLVAGGFDADPTLDEKLRRRWSRQEHALVSLAESCRTGREMTPDYLGELARSLTDRAGADLGWRLADCLTGATAARTHPVVRAALVYLCAERALDDTGGADGARGDGVPWAMASLVLMRANHPPLIADHRPLAARPPHQRAAQPRDRLLRLVGLFTELQITVVRGELSWAASGGWPEARGSGRTLALGIYRRLLDYLRQRAPALSMMLRELDSSSTVRVSAGDLTDEGGHRARMDLAANRALFDRGGSSWWVCLEADGTDTALRLLVTVQEVGAPTTGVLAVTADALLDSPDGSEDALDLASTDCVTLLSTDSVDERWPAVEELADEVISRAVGRLTSVMA